MPQFLAGLVDLSGCKISGAAWLIVVQAGEMSVQVSEVMMQLGACW